MQTPWDASTPNPFLPFSFIFLLNTRHTKRNHIQIITMAPLRTIPDLLQHILRTAHLDRIRPKALVLPWGVALLAGVLARAAVALGDDGLGGAEGQGEAVLREVGAGGTRGTGPDELPLVEDVADFDAGVGGGAAVGAEGAGGGYRRRGRGR